jgi:recombination protein RecR
VDYPAPVARLIDELRRLPGIGPKSAQRIAFHLLRAAPEEVARLGTAVSELLAGIRLCASCNAVTDRETCDTCSDPARNDRVICVVEEPHNLPAVERTRDRRALPRRTARCRPCRSGTSCASRGCWPRAAWTR